MVQSDARPALVSNYESEVFVPTDSWKELHRILERGKGGSIGLSGPRGIGKSWLMHRAKDWAMKDHSGFAVLFPSSSEYDPIAFVGSLSDVVAKEFQEHFDETNKVELRVTRRRAYRSYLAGIILLYGGMTIFMFTDPLRILHLHLSISFLGIFAALIPFSLGLYMMAKSLRLRRQRQSGPGKVRDKSEEFRQRIRYAMSSTESVEMSASGARGGIGAGLKRAREHRLTERPVTLSSVIHDFRSFVRDIDRAYKGPVLIMIDELDKMPDPQHVAALLRDIKGIFQVEHVFVVVSISREAARFLDLGTVKARTEFNSSFDVVLNLDYIHPFETSELLSLQLNNWPCRIFGGQAEKVVGILSGGIPREITRMGDMLINKGISGTRKDACFGIMENELTAFMNQILDKALSMSQSPPGLGAEQAEGTLGVRLLRMIPEDISRNQKSIADLAARAMTLWDCGDLREPLPDSDVILLEEWRRLLARLAVCCLLMNDCPEMDSAAELQDIIRIASASSSAARFRLASYLIRRIGAVEAQTDKLCATDLCAIPPLLEVSSQADPVNALISRLNSYSESQVNALKKWRVIDRRRRGLRRSWDMVNGALYKWAALRRPHRGALASAARAGRRAP